MSSDRTVDVTRLQFGPDVTYIRSELQSRCQVQIASALFARLRSLRFRSKDRDFRERERRRECNKNLSSPSGADSSKVHFKVCPIVNIRRTRRRGRGGNFCHHRLSKRSGGKGCLLQNISKPRVPTSLSKGVSNSDDNIYYGFLQIDLDT